MTISEVSNMANTKNDSDILYLSIGENCLSDDILKRHNLKSFSTPYSSGRTNIDYVLQLETIDYNIFLNKRYLEYSILMGGGTKVVKSKLITACSNIYNAMHMDRFEFTHQDILSSDEQNATIKRRIERMRQFRGRQDVVFFYHHRVNKSTNLDILFDKLSLLQTFYSSDQARCIIVLFAQKLIPKDEQKSLEYKQQKKDMLLFTFKTYDIWGGNDQDIFWARVDDNLIKQMLDMTNNYVKENI
ncbi:MAG: papain-like cysteine peptidase [Campylobacteraceae bacterium]|jgi:hypothetical protein|nr:papain-like cysteine peptidase [Campylobacteraceae bacterium]